MKQVAFFIVLVIVMPGLQAQYQESLPQARPMPPNTAELFKPLEKPVGTFTGTIPINFPLCEVSSGPLTSSVSLAYTSTGGIKVEELGGAVGLGFGLNDGGGKIVQSVRGSRPDDFGGGLLFENMASFDCAPAVADESYTGHRDLEPDVFMYNFNGRSGKFYFDMDDHIMRNNNENIKIEYTNTLNGITNWVLTDEQGRRYYFGRKTIGVSEYQSQRGSGGQSYSSIIWYLERIEDMNNENWITFSYVTSSNLFTTYSGGFVPFPLSADMQYRCTYFNTEYDESVVTTTSDEWLISRIDAKSGSVIFNSTVLYQWGPRRINSIELRDPNNNLKKRFEFNYGAFWAGRQKLLNFVEYGNSGTEGLTTKFDYYQDIDLPEPMSSSVDIWGYHNGASNNGRRVPGISYGVLGTGTTAPVPWPNAPTANRMPGWPYAKAYILTKITYPTGGYREIDYEPNTVLANGNYFNYHSYGEVLTPFLTERNFWADDVNQAPSWYPSLMHNFTIQSNEPYTLFLYTVAAECQNYTVKIYRLFTPDDEVDPAAEVPPTPNGLYYLANGLYRLAVFINDPSTCPNFWGVSAFWVESSFVDEIVNTPYGSFSKFTRSAGGVRVKEVRDYDPVTGKTNKREYKYNMYSVNPALTSGMVISPVDIVSGEQPAEVTCNFLKVTSQSTYPLAAEGGSYVVYPEVRTIDNGNGWTDHLFKYQADVQYTGSPAVPPVDYSGYRGQVRFEKVYNEAGTLIKQKENQFTERASLYMQLALKVKPYWHYGFPNGPNLWMPYRPPTQQIATAAACSWYFAQGLFCTLDKSIETDYTPGANLTKTTTYTYGNYNDYYYLQKESTIDSRGADNERTYRYAFTNASEFELGLTSSEQTTKATLLSKNFSAPLEVIDRVGSQLVYGSKYIFAAYNGTKLHLNKFRLHTKPLIYTETNFSNYDANGNLTEQYKTNDVKEVILWGYNGAYPVAKIKGSDYATVVGLVNTAVLNNPSSDAALRTEINNIRTALATAKAQVTTYTYNPLYGMSSMTDPAGRTAYYEYDALGRLKIVRDQDNNILKQYQYKLVNP